MSCCMLTASALKASASCAVRPDVGIDNEYVAGSAITVKFGSGGTVNSPPGGSPPSFQFHGYCATGDIFVINSNIWSNSAGGRCLQRTRSQHAAAHCA